MLYAVDAVRVLLVDDNAELRELVTRALVRDGHAVTAVATVAAARASLERWLLGFAAMVQVLMVMPAVGWFYDDRYLTISLAYVLASVLLTAVFARRPTPAGHTPPEAAADYDPVG